MLRSSRTLIACLAVAVIAVTVVLRLTRRTQVSAPIVSTVPAPVQHEAGTRAPVVLDQPPVVVREPKQPITPTQAEPEPVVTRVEHTPTQDSANLGRVRLIRPATAEENAELELKLERYLKNQADARAEKNPR